MDSFGMCTSSIGVIVVDVQGDFTVWKQGSLAVPGTDADFIADVRNATIDLKREGFLIFGSQDWHPPDHISFHTNHANRNPFEIIHIRGRSQVLWPPHCVQASDNARLLLDPTLFTAVIKKGQDRRYDSYSAFKDDGGADTGLEGVLKQNGVQKVVIYGLATDYCVKATAMDAHNAGFKVVVIEGLCKGVAEDTTTLALQEMRAMGIEVIAAPEIELIRRL